MNLSTSHQDKSLSAFVSPSVCSSSSLSVCPSVATHQGLSKGINPYYRNDHENRRIYFTTIKKLNTYYLRMSLCINSKHSDSVTVSLRTTNYREAMNNSKYLKDQLLAKAGSYLSFEHMREDLKTTARECLQRQGTEWFFKGALKEAQEAITMTTTNAQLAYLSDYMSILKKGLEGDTQSLINTVININDNHQSLSDTCDSVTFESNSNSLSQTFSSYVETFINDKVSSQSWTEATAKAQGATLRKLCEHVAGLNWSTKNIAQITREDLLELRTVLIESGLKVSAS